MQREPLSYTEKVPKNRVGVLSNSCILLGKCTFTKRTEGTQPRSKLLDKQNMTSIKAFEKLLLEGYRHMLIPHG